MTFPTVHIQTTQIFMQIQLYKQEHQNQSQ